MNGNISLNSGKPESWRQKHRTLIINIAFFAFWIAFSLVFKGKTEHNNFYVLVSIVLFCGVGLVPLVIRKQSR